MWARKHLWSPRTSQVLPVHGDLCTAQRMPWKVPGFSMELHLLSFSHHLEDLMGNRRFSQWISLNRVFTLVRRSHWKFPGFDSVSWRPLHSPEDASRIPRISQGPLHSPDDASRNPRISQGPLDSPEDASRNPRISHGLPLHSGLYIVQSPLKVQIGWMSCDIHTIYNIPFPKYHTTNSSTASLTKELKIVSPPRFLLVNIYYITTTSIKYT